MMLRKARLIPRYNWDYGVLEFCQAVVGSLRKARAGRAIEQSFGHAPILTNSGRSSLFAILKALGLPKGAQVGVPLFCCPVVFEAISQAGLVPRFIDIDLRDYTLAPDDLRLKIKELAAVVVVHMFGHPADMDAINGICGDTPVIEDCAQSLFSSYRGEIAGFRSTASFFSFRSGKYLSAGEGSAIFAQAPELASEIAKIVERFPEHSIVGEIQHSLATYIKSVFYHRPWYGTIGVPLGKKLDERYNLTAKSGFEPTKIRKSDLAVIEYSIESFAAKIRKQREHAHLLLETCRESRMELPHERENSESNYYQFAVRLASMGERDKVAEMLDLRGIDCAKYLDGIAGEASLQYGYQGDCPRAEHASRTVLSIPHYYSLSDRTMTHISRSLVGVISTVAGASDQRTWVRP